MYEIIDDNGVIHSGTEEEMTHAFADLQEPLNYNDEELSQTLWENKIIHIADEYNDFSDYTFYHSPKEAYEAAITYCLTEII